MVGGDSIEAGRIFFVGAGFSAAAGLPLTNTLLPRALRCFSEECPGIYERVSNYAQDTDLLTEADLNAEDFSSLSTYLDFLELREHAGGERWSDEGSRERLALKFFLAKTIALSSPSTENVPEIFKKFCLDLRPNDIVISFNWDTLLETAFGNVGVPYTYSFEDNAVPIAKLHGSINWINGAPRRMRGGTDVTDYEPINANGNLGNLDVYASRRLTTPEEWRIERPLVGPAKPLLVLPGYGKAIDTRLLAPFWYRPEYLAIRRGGVSIIGLGISDDDYLLASLFRYLFRSSFPRDIPIVVVNPDEGAHKRFSSLAGNSVTLRHEITYFDENSIEAAMLRI